MDFLAAHCLPERWQNQSSFTLLQFDFADALGLLQTWQAWQNHPNRSQRCYFFAFVTGTEPPACPHPDLAGLHAELVSRWPVMKRGFQRIHLAGGQFILTLIWGDSLTLLRNLNATIDAADLTSSLSPAHYKALWRLSGPQTRLFAADQTDAALQKSAGYRMEPHGKGFAGLCTRPPFNKTTMYPHHALIIGAGIAGTSVAERLAARGWKIDILEAEADIATQSSGNLAGLFHATASRDDNISARLSRSGCHETLQHLQYLKNAGLPVFFGAGGLLQIAKDDEQSAQMKDIAAQLPDGIVRWLSQSDAAKMITGQPSHDGWWFPEGGWANPASLCQANLARHPALIQLHCHSKADRLLKTADGWQVLDASGKVLAAAPVVILANATDALPLLPDLDLPLSRTLRSTTLVADFKTPACSLTGPGYLTPAFQGYRCIGAAEVFNDDLTAAEQKNLAGLNQLLPGLPDMPALSSRACYRPNSLDRLPLVGALHDPDIEGALHQLHQIPRQKGLFSLLGLGAHGLSRVIICAEALACQLNGEPAPLEADLLQAIDPARFLLRKHRRSHAKNEAVSKTA